MEPYCYIVKEKNGTFVKSYASKSELCTFLKSLNPNLAISKYQVIEVYSDSSQSEMNLALSVEPVEVPVAEAMRWYNKQVENDSQLENISYALNKESNIVLLTRIFTDAQLIAAYQAKNNLMWKDRLWN